MGGGLWVGIDGNIVTVDAHPTTAHVLLQPPLTTLAIAGLHITTGGDRSEPNPVMTCLVATLTGQLVHHYGPALISGPASTPLPAATLNTLATHLTRIRVQQGDHLAQLAAAARIARTWHCGSSQDPQPTWPATWTERTSS